MNGEAEFVDLSLTASNGAATAASQFVLTWIESIKRQNDG
jgi:hypothetical protein